jgi:hypothetical protein
MNRACKKKMFLLKKFISLFEKNGKIQVITFNELGDWDEKEMDNLRYVVYCDGYLGKCVYRW